MSKIEDVKKILRDALWMAYCSGMAMNRYIPEEVLPDLMKRCHMSEPEPREVDAIARRLRTYKLGEVEVFDPTEDGILPWDVCGEETKQRWRDDVLWFLGVIDSRGYPKPPEIEKKEVIDG